MHADEYRRMFELENRYWWFVARRRLALKLLRTALSETANGQPPTANRRILDLGCGTGAVLQELAAFGTPIGVDMSPLALGFCRERGLTGLVIGRGEHIPIRSGSVDAVVALDVFEHIEDDTAAFAEASRVLKPGGVLVLSVPAFMSLWGPHDVALFHFRRYRKGQVRARLREAGLRPEKLSYAIFLLFPLVAAIRFFEKRKKGDAKASLPALPKGLNRALIGLQSFEAGLIRAVPLPWGSSVVAVARKPDLA